MDCPTCRDVVSAQLDGEASLQEVAAADHHLASCPACRLHRAEVLAVHRSLRGLGPAEDVPDLSAAILGAAPAPSTSLHDDATVWRVGLVLVAVAQLVAAATHVGDGHLARDQACWEAAIAAGFAWAAWRPDRTAGLLPVASVLTVLLLVNGGLAAGAAGSHHLLAPVGLVLLVLAGHGRSGRRLPGAVA